MARKRSRLPRGIKQEVIKVLKTVYDTIKDEPVDPWLYGSCPECGSDKVKVVFRAGASSPFFRMTCENAHHWTIILDGLK